MRLHFAIRLHIFHSTWCNPRDKCGQCYRKSPFPSILMLSPYTRVKTSSLILQGSVRENTCTSSITGSSPQKRMRLERAGQSWAHWPGARAIAGRGGQLWSTLSHLYLASQICICSTTRIAVFPLPTSFWQAWPVSTFPNVGWEWLGQDWESIKGSALEKKALPHPPAPLRIKLIIVLLLGFSIG